MIDIYLVGKVFNQLSVTSITLSCLNFIKNDYHLHENFFSFANTKN